MQWVPLFEQEWSGDEEHDDLFFGERSNEWLHCMMMCATLVSFVFLKPFFLVFDVFSFFFVWIREHLIRSYPFEKCHCLMWWESCCCCCWFFFSKLHFRMYRNRALRTAFSSLYQLNRDRFDLDQVSSHCRYNTHRRHTLFEFTTDSYLFNGWLILIWLANERRLWEMPCKWLHWNFRLVFFSCFEKNAEFILALLRKYICMCDQCDSIQFSVYTKKTLHVGAKKSCKVSYGK